MSHLRRILRIFVWCFIDIAIVAAIAFALVIVHLESELPDVSVLKDVQMQVPMQVYTADGKLISEFSDKRRIPVPYDQIPPQLINAVLATEDQRFFEHQGVDFLGLARAGLQLILTGTKSQGGSTITMQVARNFFLDPKKNYTRKFKEILLAMKIEQEFSKQKILDLYLNKIYFGSRAYGVAAAAQVYYGKTLNQLTLPEMAMIAGLPKGPSMLNPITNPSAAKDRRDHVLQRMLEHGYITQAEYNESINAPVATYYHVLPIDMDAPYVAEMVRNAMVSQFGAEHAYTAGFKVYTTVNSVYQHQADQALRSALLAYDQRHGYRGPVKQLGNPPADLSSWKAALNNLPVINSLQPAVILSVYPMSATAMLANGKNISLAWNGLSWARRKIGDKSLGAVPKTASNVVRVGDVVYVDPQQANGEWWLSQKPQIEGALVALNPNDGAILALAGGFDYDQSKYNRVTQAKRQPGSSFKPFIYAAALAKGYTLATVINDAPIVITMPDGVVWRPQNTDKRFYGPTRLRVALIKSRNLVSIRLLQMIGISYTVRYLSNFGFDPHGIPHAPSLALGTASLTPLEMATGYAVFANGGYRVMPYFIDHILDANDHVVYQAQPKIACESCLLANDPALWSSPDVDTSKGMGANPINVAPETINPQVAYMMTSAMKDVVQFGTASKARSMGRQDLAGKTGTTNDTKDAWFAGFNSDLVAVAWVGYDQPRATYEYGAQAALPMWMDFIQQALQGQPEHTMPEPSGLVTVRIDPNTGKLAAPWQKDTTYEIFRQGDINMRQNNDNWVNPDEETRDEGFTYRDESGLSSSSSQNDPSNDDSGSSSPQYEQTDEQGSSQPESTIF
ncbi:MAG: penicillin-binding protein 1A [Legionellales bacterium]|nr:penicillin-binding protein 1A [Legionellales bacterium]